MTDESTRIIREVLRRLMAGVKLGKPQTMHRLLVTLLILAAAGRAEAHVGFENNTEIRLFSDVMRIVVRTSIPFAWAVLGDRAPAMADTAGQTLARPLLTAAAPTLFNVTAGGQPMTPVATDCLFEVHEDVAFILTFARPAAWPVVVEARFFAMLGTLDSGTITVFDYTASRFSRDLEPLAQTIISRQDPSLSFTVGAPATIAPPVEAVPPGRVPAIGNSLPRIRIAISLGLIATAGIGYLAYRRLRQIKRQP